MEDEYKKLAECLTTIIIYLEEFNQNFSDMLKPKVRAYQIELQSYAKIIGGKTKDDMETFSSSIDNYLSHPQKEEFIDLINNAKKLQNDLWEL